MSHPSVAFLREDASGYTPGPLRGAVYEVSMRTAASTDWLKDLRNAHRLVQALLTGKARGDFDLLDFLLWPEGVFLRVRLEPSRPLGELLKFLREASTPPGKDPFDHWDDDLEWLRLVPPQNLSASTQAFLERADRFRRETAASHGFSPSLFFFYRDSTLSR